MNYHLFWRMFFLLFLQIFVADYLRYFFNFPIYLQIFALAWFPVQISFLRALPFFLIFAFLIDLFNHTLGLNLFVCTLVLYLRQFLIPFFTDTEDNTEHFHIYNIGFFPFLYYFSILTFTFYLTIFSVEFFRWEDLNWLLYQVIFGSLLFSCFGVFIDFLTVKSSRT